MKTLLLVAAPDASNTFGLWHCHNTPRGYFTISENGHDVAVKETIEEGLEELSFRAGYAARIFLNTKPQPGRTR